MIEPNPVFNPTAGIPKTSYNEKSSPSFDNATWFSTVQPVRGEYAIPNRLHGAAINAEGDAI